MENIKKNDILKSISKSVANIKTKVEKQKESFLSTDIKKRIASIAGVTLLMTSGAAIGVTGGKVVDNLSNIIEVNDFANGLKDEYQRLVADSTHQIGVNDKSEPVFWYDTDYMASKVSELGDDFEMEKALLGIYKNTRVSKNDTLNDIIWKLSRKVDEKSYFSITNSLEKYCDDRGFDINKNNEFESYILQKEKHIKESGGMKL